MTATLATLAPSAATMTSLLALAAKAALLLAAAALTARTLRRSSAAARHHIWALGVAAALLVPLFTLALPARPLPAWTSPVRAASPTPTLNPAAANIAADTTTRAPTPIIAAATPTPTSAPTWPTWLALTWALGIAVVSLRLVRGHRAAARLWRDATTAHPPTWTAAWHDAAAALAITAPVALGRSAAIRSPMTLGVLRRRVLLPAAADTWSPARLRAVLTHELGHVRRRDTLIQLAAQLACALYWWNPLAWRAAARLRLEREHACDDLVLSAGIAPSSYAADLLALARGFAESPAGAVSTVGLIGIVDPSSTEARVRRILDPAPARRPFAARIQRTVAAVAILATAAVACTRAPADRAPPAPSPTAAITTNITAPAVAPSPTAAALPASTDHIIRAHCPTAAAPSAFYSPPLGFDNPPLLEVKGPLAPAVIEREIARHRADLEQCYQRQLAAHPALAGRILVHWNIDTTGAVVEQCITEDTVGDAALLACVNHLVAAARYPAPSTAATVSYPFLFTANPGC